MIIGSKWSGGWHFLLWYDYRSQGKPTILEQETNQSLSTLTLNPEPEGKKNTQDLRPEPVKEILYPRTQNQRNTPWPWLWNQSHRNTLSPWNQSQWKKYALVLKLEPKKQKRVSERKFGPETSANSAPDQLNTKPTNPWAKNILPCQVVVTHTFNPNTQEGEAGESLWVGGQAPKLHKETLSQKNEGRKEKESKYSPWENLAPKKSYLSPLCLSSCELSYTTLAEAATLLGSFFPNISLS